VLQNCVTDEITIGEEPPQLSRLRPDGTPREVVEIALDAQSNVFLPWGSIAVRFWIETLDLLNCVFRLRSDDDVQGCAPFQSDRFAPGIDQSVSNTNSLIRIVSTLNGNLNFLGFARNHGLNDFLHGARQTAGCVMMHAGRTPAIHTMLFSGALLSNNDQPAQVGWDWLSLQLNDNRN
jgi:hypothetical protein